MEYMKFQEYLDRNKKLVTSPSVEKVADYKGEKSAKPSKEKKHKDAGGKGQVGSPKSYKSGSDAKDPNKGKMKGGFAEKGNKELKVDVADNCKGGKKAVSDNQNGVPGGKTIPGWKPTKTQEWIDRTKNMSLAQFTKEIRDEALDGLNECECNEASSTIKNAAAICKCNKKYLSSLVREMKRNDMINDLVQEMVNHSETFDVLSKIVENNETVSRKLFNVVNEMVSPPVGGPADDEESMPKQKHHHDDEDEFEDKEMGSGHDDDDDEMGSDDDEIESDDDMSDDMDDEAGEDNMDGEEEDMGDDETTGDEEKFSDTPENPKVHSFKKMNFPHHTNFPHRTPDGMSNRFGQ